ncbi:bifunctional enoyl-CoA hydratase/phosphate acetyltransferase [Dankookia sp. GCM10030260]|uniref:bifunctional enoyl-CoA hydratase/phosphate acetyltransferase n=1 Tax=Dankookia sp. GCM10030260 TaxID=3273390 RepID=UPI0036163B2D
MSTDIRDTEQLVGLTRDNIAIGMTASIEHVLQERSFDLVAALFGVPDPACDLLPDAASALLVQGILLDFTARCMPGPGCDIRSQELRFMVDPVPGDRILVHGVVTARPSQDSAIIAILLECQRGRIAEGSVTVRLPAEQVTRPLGPRPDIILHRHEHLKTLLRRSAEAKPLTVVVAWPCDRDSLLGPLQARDQGAMRPILVGPRATIEAVAVAAGTRLDDCELIDAETPHAAAAAAVRLCREGRAGALMKGSLHTDDLMAAVVARDGGLRGTRRISHVFALDVPSYHKALFITDAAINIAPDLITKADIIQNAVDMLHALGNAAPKVAILSAVETVNPKIPGTLDAAALCKMADRGQITGALLDGPLAFDNAISRAAAAIKKIASPVAGDADILVAPNLEAGNMIAKQLSYLAGADSAGIVLGARVPVILTSRADSVTSRLASIALARLLSAAAQREPRA